LFGFRRDEEGGAAVAVAVAVVPDRAIEREEEEEEDRDERRGDFSREFDATSTTPNAGGTTAAAAADGANASAEGDDVDAIKRAAAARPHPPLRRRFDGRGTMAGFFFLFPFSPPLF